MLWILKWNMSRDFSTEEPGFVSISQEEEEEEEEYNKKHSSSYRLKF